MMQTIDIGYLIYIVVIGLILQTILSMLFIILILLCVIFKRNKIYRTGQIILSVISLPVLIIGFLFTRSILMGDEIIGPDFWTLDKQFVVGTFFILLLLNILSIVLRFTTFRKPH